jgi:hypothetical protein
MPFQAAGSVKRLLIRPERVLFFILFQTIRHHSGKRG